MREMYKKNRTNHPETGIKNVREREAIKKSHNIILRFDILEDNEKVAQNMIFQ